MHLSPYSVSIKLSKSLLCLFYGVIVYISMKCFVSKRELKFRGRMAVACRRRTLPM